MNISTSGILVASFDTVPFNIKTLLEVIIDPDSEFLSQAIKCVAKIVGIEKGSSSEISSYNASKEFSSKIRSLVGIKISDISNSNNALLEEYIHKNLT